MKAHHFILKDRYTGEYFSPETGPLLKNKTKPIKYSELPFGAYFKRGSGVSSEMSFVWTDRQIE